MSDSLPPVPHVLHRTTREGRQLKYIIKDKMGSGGFAVVYSGEEMPGRTPVAIKCITQQRVSDPKVKRKLVSEVEIHKSLHHKNIVRFYGVFQDENYVYLVLELCQHGTVLEMLKKHNPFSEEQTSKICFQLVCALVYLHEHRVIHRDLKLQNLLLDENDVMKLADFGLSAHLESDDEKKMTICGTPSYLSPEVVVGGKKGHTYSVDIWATGVCAFLMLTGKQPFQSSDKKITYKKISHVNYVWPERPHLSEEAHDFVDRALQKDPESRPVAKELLSHPFIVKYNREALLELGLNGTKPNVSSPLSYNPSQNDLHASQTKDSTLTFTSRSHNHTEKEMSASRSGEIPSDHHVIRLPSYAIRIWWDYSHRYGLAYLLHNHICGACFNDSSRILIDPEGTFCQYWATPQTPQPDIIDMSTIDTSPIRKKMLLIQHFAAELKQRAGTLRYPPLEIKSRDQVIPHVKYWARTKEGVLFRMANRDIQANFRDHTKLVIESTSKALYYDNSQEVVQLTLADLGDRERYHEVRKRFVIVKEMAKELI